jgi:hypothetical protein
MIHNDIKWLQVENTTKCNAWCPACARNNNGFGLSNIFTLQDLDPVIFENTIKLFPNLETIQFCGTYGDFAAAKNVNEHVDIAIKYAKKIQIHTHGGIRDQQWWQDLAVKLSTVDHNIWFAIDGLKGVHEIYRQGTSFDKTIANACAFINQGGHATWQFIPWSHNEHQIMSCMKMSQDLGFKEFKFVKSVRTNFQGKHWRTGQTLEFKTWSQDKDFNKYASKNRNQVLEKDCMHLTLPSVYLNATGKLSVCCDFNLIEQVDNFDQLANIKQELAISPRKTCLQTCGSCATI